MNLKKSLGEINPFPANNFSNNYIMFVSDLEFKKEVFKNKTFKKDKRVHESNIKYSQLISVKKLS